MAPVVYVFSPWLKTQHAGAIAKMDAVLETHSEKLLARRASKLKNSCLSSLEVACPLASRVWGVMLHLKGGYYQNGIIWDQD